MFEELQGCQCVWNGVGGEGWVGGETTSERKWSQISRTLKAIVGALGFTLRQEPFLVVGRAQVVSKGMT